MKTIALFLLALYATQAVFIKRAADPNAPVFTQLEEIDGNEMGRKLLDTISLQMKNKAPLQDIARMLQNLRENLVLQQQDADVVHAGNEADCAAEIAGYNRRIDFASNEITDSTTQIATLTTNFQLEEKRIENIGVQLQTLTTQEELVRKTRTEEAEAYKVRVVQTREVLDALTVIATKLGAITPESDNKAVFLELHKMGATNPIAALVSLASAFSPERLANVQSKIGELRESIQQSVVDDEANEVQAQIDFQNLIQDFAEQRKNLVSQKEETETKHVTTTNQLAFERKRNEDAGKELTSATNGLKQKTEECENQRTIYNRDTEHRNSEIAIIRKVEEILATKLEGASSYLQERVESI